MTARGEAARQGRWIVVDTSALPSSQTTWPGDLPDGAAVEYLDDDVAQGVLRRGHPGRVTDGAEQDVFVDWVGLESHMVSMVCYDVDVVGLIGEDEFARRANALRSTR